MPSVTRITAVALAAVLASACGNGAPSPPASTTTPSPTASAPPATSSLTLVTHDSFNLSDDVLALFTEQTGIAVEVLRSGDAGSMLNQAILTKDNPLGDVIFGIDNVALSRALAEGILAEHPTPLPDDVDPTTDLDPTHRAIPIDRGDVCVNFDREAFAQLELEVPTTLEELATEPYASRLVVEDPSTSSVGLAFLLATIAAFGEDGWQDYWADLRAGGVTISSGWEDAYYGQFSGGSGEGDRPLVVSYASSPVAEVVFGADPEAAESPTGVITGTCFAQVEFAGTLTGTAHPEAAAQLVDFLLSDEVQQDIPLQMFVEPVRDVPLPEVFVRHAVEVTDPWTLPGDLIVERRDGWVSAWVDLMLR